MDINYIIWENAAVKVASTFDFTVLKTAEIAIEWAEKFRDPESELSLRSPSTRKMIVTEYERLLNLYGY